MPRNEGLRIPTFTDRVSPAGVPEARGVELGAGDGGRGSLASRIAAITEGLTREAQQDAEEEAWQAGTVAGEAQPGTRMEDGGRVYRSAFNRAAADAGQRRLEVMARQQLATLAEQHGTDPAAFSAAAASWRDGIAGSLPPTFAARFQTGFDLLALPAFGAIRDAQRRAVADQAVATWTEALPARLAGLEQAAGRAVEDPASATSFRAQEDQAIAELVALGPREAFTLGGQSYPADASRTGALSLQQVARQAEALRAHGREALVVGAWRAAGGGRAWIDGFERRSAMPGDDWTQRNATTARPIAAPEALAARLPAGWRPVIDQAAQQNGLDAGLLAAMIGLESGGRAGATSPAGAVGPAQILPSTAADPGFGLAPLPREALTDPARAIPWAAGYLARLRDHFGGDLARVLAAYNAGARTVETAAREGRLLPAETRAYLATLLPAAASGGAPLPDTETQRIAARLRGLQASEDAAAAEGRTEARAELARQVTENLAAIGVAGRPVRPLDPELVARAGEDPLRLAERERSAIERYSADQTARSITDPAELAALAEQFAPGTANFRADPQAAVQLLASLRARGVTVQGGALAERLRDLETEAQASGQAAQISAEEARAAGLTPERRDEVNRGLALTAELARLRQDGERLPPPQRQAAIDRFPVTGDGARENAMRLRALAEAFKRRDDAVAEDPAGYVLGMSPALRESASRVAAGDLAWLPGLVRQTQEEQRRIGVPEERIAAVAPAVGRGIAAGLAALPDDAQRMQRLVAMTERLPDPQARAEVFTALAEAGLPAHLVNAARIAPRLGPALAARVASELGVELRALQLTPTQQREIREAVAVDWTGSDRLGGLRQAQAAATGNAGFLRIASEEEKPLTHIATVRAAPDGSIGGRAVRDAYGHLYGGVAVVNRPGEGVLAAVPAGTDAATLTRGLGVVLRQDLAARLPGTEAAVLDARARVSRGIWADAGVGRLQFYPEGSPLPLAGADGQPLTVTVEQALAAARVEGPPARDAASYLRAQQRAQEQQGRQMGGEDRRLEQLRRQP